MLYYSPAGRGRPKLDDLEEPVLPVASDEGERLLSHGDAVRIELAEHVGATFSQRQRSGFWAFVDFLLGRSS